MGNSPNRGKGSTNNAIVRSCDSLPFDVEYAALSTNPSDPDKIVIFKAAQNNKILGFQCSHTTRCVKTTSIYEEILAEEKQLSHSIEPKLGHCALGISVCNAVISFGETYARNSTSDANVGINYSINTTENFYCVFDTLLNKYTHHHFSSNINCKPKLISTATRNLDEITHASAIVDHKTEEKKLGGDCDSKIDININLDIDDDFDFDVAGNVIEHGSGARALWHNNS